MLDIAATFKDIRTLYQAIANKNDVDVSLTYKGTSYGVTKPFQVKVDAREFSHETFDGALTEMLASLKKELSDKIKSTESEANRLKATFGQLGN